MPGELAQLTWLLALSWFLIYWLLGGMMFAVVALTRLLRIKKAQFSCLFSLACGAAAYGAAVTSLMMSSPKSALCFGTAMKHFDLGGVANCGVREIFLAGGAWFAVLLLLSILFMLLSQRDMFPPAKLEHH